MIGGRSLVSVVMPFRDAGATVEEEDLRQHVRELTSHFKVPREVHFVLELPRSSTGKIEKARLRSDLHTAATNDSASNTPACAGPSGSGISHPGSLPKRLAPS